MARRQAEMLELSWPEQIDAFLVTDCYDPRGAYSHPLTVDITHMVLSIEDHARSSIYSIEKKVEIMAQHKYSVMDVEDYLILDRNSKNACYEYLDGEVRMLAGGSPDHSIIIANLTAAIKGPLKGSQCRVYNSDVRLQLSEKRYVHPILS